VTDLEGPAAPRGAPHPLRTPRRKLPGRDDGTTITGPYQIAEDLVSYVTDFDLVHRRVEV
jgi:hypothetical protein